MDRRTVLRGVTVAAAALAGCGGGSDGETTTLDADVVVDLVDYAFEPGTESALEVEAGDTVGFVWKTGGHNIHVDSQPDGANWKGHESVESQGFTYTHTFDTKGDYHFWCVPHKELGMVGDITVT